MPRTDLLRGPRERGRWLGALVAALSVSALAQTPPPSRPLEPIRGENAIPTDATVVPRRRPAQEPSKIESQLEGVATRVDANLILDEMLDEFAADVARLGAAQTSPLLLERIQVSDNMDPNFAHILESRMVAALLRASGVAVAKCFECFSTRGRIDNATWIVSRGITRKEELAETAAKYGAKMIMTASLTLYSQPSSMALDVQLVRASDGIIAFAEGYRATPDTTLLYRSADRAQKREARLQELEARVAQRPVFNHAAFGGAMLLPTLEPDAAPEGAVLGGYFSYRVYERFGDDEQLRVGVNGSIFSNPRRLPFSLLASIVLQHRFTPRNIHLPTCHAGAQAGFIVSGASDGLVGSPSFGASAECVFIYRISVQAGLDFVMPYVLGENGYSYGSLTPWAGMGISW